MNDPIEEEIPLNLPELLFSSLKITQSPRRFDKVDDQLIEVDPGYAEPYKYAQFGELIITADPKEIDRWLSGPDYSHYKIPNYIAGRIEEIRVVYLRVIKSDLLPSLYS